MEPSAFGTKRNVFSRIGMSCLVILVLATALQFAAMFAIRFFATQWADRSWYPWAVTLIPLYAVGVPVGVALFTRIPEYKPYPRKLHFKDLLIFLVMCFPIMYIGNLVGSAVTAALHGILGTEAQNPLDSFIFGSNVWLAAVAMVLLAPVIEEFVFRKLIIDRLRPYGEGVCILVSALLFGLFHGNLNQFFYAFGVGALFAFVYVKTGHLRYSIFMHMVINLLGGVIAPYLVKNLNLGALQQPYGNPEAYLNSLMTQVPQLLGFALYSLLNLSLVIAGFVLLIVKRRAFVFERGPLQPELGKGFQTLFVNPGMILFFVGALALFVLSLL